MRLMQQFQIIVRMQKAGGVFEAETDSQWFFHTPFGLKVVRDGFLDKAEAFYLPSSPNHAGDSDSNRPPVQEQKMKLSTSHNDDYKIKK